MNWFPALVHGEQILVGLGLGALIACILVPALLYICLRHTEISELQLALTYFTVTAVLCGFSAFGPDNPPSISSATAFTLTFILTLPWNALVGVFSLYRDTYLSDRQFAVVMLFGAVSNAVLLYFAAIKLRRIIR